MTYIDKLALLKEMGAVVFATTDENGQPHSRYINIGVGGKEGLFFMTSPKTAFYQQLKSNSKLSITGMKQTEEAIEVVRIEGEARQVSNDRLAAILKDNPYVNEVYRNKDDRNGVQAFQVYKGKGTYHHLQKGQLEPFEFDVQ